MVSRSIVKFLCLHAHIFHPESRRNAQWRYHKSRLDETQLSDFADFDNHREVHLFTDRQTGLTSIIAIHDTTLGPALGGCRMWVYDTTDAAITDALRLSRGMTYKNALAGLDYGGGKGVIIGNPHEDKTPALFSGVSDKRSSNWPDVTSRPKMSESTLTDMALISETTRFARGTKASGLGDPSPFTALGVFFGIKAAVRHRFGTGDMSGLTASVKGLGHVGMRVASKLHAAGAKLIVSDIYPEAVEKAVTSFNAEAIDPDDAHKAKADLFCAMRARRRSERPYDTGDSGIDHCRRRQQSTGRAG